MILSIMTASGCAPAAKDAHVDDASLTIVACSDFQNPNGNESGAEFVKSVLMRISEDHPEVGGFLCSGDYDIDLTYDSPADTDEGIAALQSALHSVFGDDIHEAYCQGNHDAYDATLLSPSGNNDPENGKFGVFVINEDDYMWYSDSWNSQSHPNMTAQAIITETANNLKTYLEEKARDGFTAPIFVISHLPLHYNMRTRLEGDSMYASYIFDVLNEAGRNGLNIVFLHGHNHSNGWDDYLGGSSVYLSKGSNINIAQESKKVFSVETLEFTYMNAGYIGYFSDPNGVGDTLTMTVFKITNDSIEISRYSKDGLHPLKAKGVPNFHKGEYDRETGIVYPTDTTIVDSPQVVELNKEITVPDWSVID